MRNGFEAITIVYENNKISRLKKRMFGSPSYEFERNKPSKTTIENKLKMNIVLVYKEKGLSQIAYGEKQSYLSYYDYDDIINKKNKFLILNSMFSCKNIITEDFLNKVYRFTH